MERKVLKVGGGTPVNSLAGSILSVVEEGYKPVLTSIGPHALNQAVKALIIAKNLALHKNIMLVAEPSFVDLETEKGIATAIEFVIVVL